MANDPYGLMMSGLPPEIAQDAQGIRRQQAIADALMLQAQKPIDPNRTAGGYVVPISPFEGIAQMAKAYMGSSGAAAADKRMADLTRGYNDFQAEEVRKYQAAKAGTPAQTVDPLTPMDDEGNANPQVQMAAKPGDARAAIEAAMLSRNPMLQKLGALDYAEMVKGPEKYDGGDRWILMKNGVEVGSIPKNASPDARLRSDTTLATHATPSGSAILQEQGQNARHATPSGSAQLQSRTTLQTHATPSGSAILSAETARRGQDQAVDPAIQARVAEARATGQTTGEARAQAALTLPQAIEKATNSISLIDQMLGTAGRELKAGEKAIAPHAGFGQVVGNGVPGLRFVHGTKAADFAALLDQIKSGAFMQAFQSLRGGGAITEKEGTKATEAITRMSMAQSEAEFVKAAREYQDNVRKGMELAKQQAGQRPPAGVLRYDANGNLIQ